MEHYVGLDVSLKQTSICMVIALRRALAESAKTRQEQSCEKAWLIPTLTRLAR